MSYITKEYKEELIQRMADEYRSEVDKGRNKWMVLGELLGNLIDEVEENVIMWTREDDSWRHYQ